MENNKTIRKILRIWEIDAIRGLLILGVIIVHLLYDLTTFFKPGLHLPSIYTFLLKYGGILFVVLSGLSITLGTKSTKRGLVVLSFGLLISLVTYLLGLVSPSFKSLLIVFGILHLLGFCMIIYPLFKRLPIGAVIAIGVIFIFIGHWIKTLPSTNGFVEFIIGFRSTKFSSGDYFPILPNLGWFLIGSVIGRTVYKNKVSLFKWNGMQNPVVRFLCRCGRNSLWIYLAHQPAIFLVLLVLL